MGLVQEMLQIIYNVCIGNDVLLTQAWNAIGDYYADRQKWLVSVSVCLSVCLFVCLSLCVLHTLCLCARVCIRA